MLFGWHSFYSQTFHSPFLQNSIVSCTIIKLYIGLANKIDSWSYNLNYLTVRLFFCVCDEFIEEPALMACSDTYCMLWEAGPTVKPFTQKWPTGCSHLAKNISHKIHRDPYRLHWLEPCVTFIKDQTSLLGHVNTFSIGHIRTSILSFCLSWLLLQAILVYYNFMQLSG